MVVDEILLKLGHIEFVGIQILVEGS